MRKRFFFKNLALFLIPLVLPLMLYGILSIVMTQINIKNDINHNNMSLLKQTQENLELVLNEIDQLSLVYDANTDIGFEMDTILKNDLSTYESNRVMKVLKGFMNAYPNARPYIHSIYIYFENCPYKLFSSSDGIVDRVKMADISWYQSYLNVDAGKTTWTGSRVINPSSAFGRPFEVVSLYKLMYSRKGVIVLNILPDYINKTLQDMKPLEDQNLLIVNENNKLLFASSLKGLSATDLDRIIKEPRPFSIENLGGKNCIVSQLQSERYSFKYISIVPQDTLYRFPFRLGELSAILLVLAFALGLLLTIYITNRNYSQIANIIALLDSAVSRQPLPPLPNRIKDEYSYIMSNILKTFIEQDYLKLSLSEKKFKMKTMELVALQAQINPHFLFNTLKTIYWSSISLYGGFNEVSTMVENLSDILHYSITNPKSFVTLGEEISATQSYAEIQKVRYSNQFDILFDINEDTKEFPVIKLLIQPILENSIYHGIKERDGKSKIKVKAFLIRDMLKISVIDNGVGIEPQKLNHIREMLKSETGFSDHIGLNNTDKRLRLHYGEALGLTIRSRKDRGTVVSVILPKSAHLSEDMTP